MVICIDRNKLLGKGSYGMVYEAIDSTTKTKYAAKIVDRDDAYIVRESLLHSKLNHPNIVKLHDAYKLNGNGAWVLILDKIDGETLYDYADHFLGRSIPISMAVNYLHQIASALNYCNNNDIIHRDVKPENIILDQNTGQCKLIDFGFCFHKADVPATTAGTSYFMPPETIHINKINNKNDNYKNSLLQAESIDVWSFGVMMHEILTGLNPFNVNEDCTFEQVMHKISCADFEIHHSIQNLDARNLIKSILVKDPLKRPTWSRILKSPFFNKICLDNQRLEKKEKRLDQEKKCRLKTSKINGMVLSLASTRWIKRFKKVVMAQSTL